MAVNLRGAAIETWIPSSCSSDARACAPSDRMIDPSNSSTAGTSTISAFKRAAFIAVDRQGGHQSAV